MIRGVRGATTVEYDKELEIIEETTSLLTKMIEANQIQADDVASVFISVTEDLTSTFPAKALRNFTGWNLVPVMCMQEIPVPNSLEKCIRIMIHVNVDRELPQKDIVHIYSRNAKKLRPDLSNMS
ncbi:chorismate mutase [Bacillus spongiae]|uniref:chorismate mutase n=1 Tax=Bacillus spongiae TaxID=2683610 RepID=A0ABU8HDQ9_9BACI